VAESTGLLNLHTGNRITSSNLVLSAIQGQRFPLALIVFIPVPGITNPHRPLSVRGIGAKRQKGFRGNLSPCPSGAVPKGLGVEGLGGLSVLPQGKTDRPPFSPKRRPVVYKTNLTNRQQKELLSVQGTKVSRFIEYAKYFVNFLKRFLH